MKRIRIYARVTSFWMPCIYAFNGTAQAGHNILGAVEAINQFAKKALLRADVEDR